MKKFARKNAVSVFFKYLEFWKKNGMVDFKEVKGKGIFAAADFIVNFNVHIRPGVDCLNDLPVKIENRYRKGEAEKYDKKGICLLVLGSSNSDETKMPDEVLQALARFLVSEGRKEFKARFKKKIIGVIYSRMNLDNSLSSLKEFIENSLGKTG